MLYGVDLALYLAAYHWLGALVCFPIALRGFGCGIGIVNLADVGEYMSCDFCLGHRNLRFVR